MRRWGHRIFILDNASTSPNPNQPDDRPGTKGPHPIHCWLLKYQRNQLPSLSKKRHQQMAILSAQSLLRTLSLFHLTLSYYLHTSPSTIAAQNLVYVLGAAMDIPDPPASLSTPSPASTLAALFLALLAIADLTSSGLPEEVGSHYWSNQAPVRLAFFFAVTGYSYAGKPGGLLGGGGKLGKGGRGGEVLCNSVVFTWGFLEMLWWFWVSDYVCLSPFLGRF